MLVCVIGLYSFKQQFSIVCSVQAVLGMDVLCQAKSGMGKTAVFVLATLQQLEPVDGQVSVLVMCHTRELAFQISKEYERFSKFLPSVKVLFLSFLQKSEGPKIFRSDVWIFLYLRNNDQLCRFELFVIGSSFETC